MNCFKNRYQLGEHRATAKSGDFSFPSGLRSPAMNSLRNVMTLLILMPFAGCSFHSAQWESAKALWTMGATATQSENETYWWEMEHEGESYRLFPVAWDGKTVLTDASRWLIVLQNSEITMIRDFQKNLQITLEDSGDAMSVVGDKIRQPSSDIGHPDFSYSGVWTGVSIVESSIRNSKEMVSEAIFCLPTRFDSQSLRLITRCSSGGQETDLRMAELDQSGNIVRLRLNLFSNKIWSIYRSNDLVDTVEIRRYLDGDVDEI